MLKIVSRSDPAMPPSQAPRVLLVDDELPVVLTLKRALRRQYEIDVALNARHALELLQAHNAYSVIVSDMNMPGTNGVDFLEQARLIAPETQRIMLTGDLERSTAVEAVNRSGVFRFVEKPCSARQLASVIDEAIAAHDALTASEKAPGQVLAAFQQDLHTPLHHILNHARLIREGMVSGMSVKDYAQHIIDSSQDLLNVSETVMDMVSLQSPDGNLQTTSIDATMIVGCAHKQMSRSAAAKGIKMSLDLPEKSLPVQGDPRLLQRAITSLLNTAVHQGAMDQTIDLSLTTAGEAQLFAAISLVWNSHMTISECNRLADVQLEGLLKGGAWLRDANALDLPLTKAIVEKFGGYLELDQPVQGKMNARIILPLDRKRPHLI